MAIQYQFNKTSLNDLNKQLKVRQRALPSIKSKESALRLEVNKSKDAALNLSKLLTQTIESYKEMELLWGEFDPSLVIVQDIDLKVLKIAGVRVPVLNQILFDEKKFSVFNRPFWYADGINILKELATIGIQQEIATTKMILLDKARKKTTQKVNLYEKVQIPGYETAIRKIKRFMEDEENLSKAGQKIVKQRQQQEVDI